MPLHERVRQLRSRQVVVIDGRCPALPKFDKVLYLLLCMILCDYFGEKRGGKFVKWAVRYDRGST